MLAPTPVAVFQWLNVSGKRSCELCGKDFEFYKKYRDDTPSRLHAWHVLEGATPALTPPCVARVGRCCWPPPA
jgi:hypothetical protein